MTYIEREALLKYCREIANNDWNKRCAPVSWADAYNSFADTVEEAAAADVAPVKYASWLLRVNKENCNYRWNVTAECDNCHFSKGEIWAGYFPGFPDELAMNVSLDSAESCELPDYCERCGCKMGWED